jgi:hypothetical protein
MTAAGSKSASSIVRHEIHLDGEPIKVVFRRPGTNEPASRAETLERAMGSELVVAAATD